MGRPTNYSVELPERCQALIDRYGAQIAKDTDPHDGFDGPLRTTFLLAMASPMLVLPLERIFKTAIGRKAGVADDLALSGKTGERVREVLGDKRPFAQAPFYVDGAWAYLPTCERFQVGLDWPAEYLGYLASDEAVAAAAAAPASDVLEAMRNGIAHGGITYLDRNGQQTDRATHMLGFASFPSFDDRKNLRLVRVGVDVFEDFLRRWTGWLVQTGAARALEDRGPGYFDVAAE
jgi:hypothetical protein